MRKSLKVTLIALLPLTMGYAQTDWTFDNIFLDFADTLGGVVQGSDGAWQNSPHGIAIAPDGNIWVNIYGGWGRMEVLASGDTVHYKPIYVLDPTTGEHVSFSPIEILTFPDGSSDTLSAESDNSGGGRGIEVDGDGNILSSHYKTLYKINYLTGEGMAMYVGESSLTEAVVDENGNIFLSYVLAGERPCLILDNDLNLVGNAIDTVGFINRSLEVSSDGQDLYIGSTWTGVGVTHWHSDIPGVLQYTTVDTFANPENVPACWDAINSAMGADSAYVVCDQADADTVFDSAPIWSSSLDLAPDGTLLVGALTAGWGGPYGGAYWFFDPATYELLGQAGIQHGDPELGGTDGPRGAAWDGSGDMYLSDFYSSTISKWSSEASISGGGNPAIPSGYVLSQNYPNPFNPNTKIEFTLPITDKVRIDIFNQKGELVRNLLFRTLEAGTHQIAWDATNSRGEPVASGTYIYSLKSDKVGLARRMVLLR